MAKITLVLGGARSGKSAFAELVALESGFRKIYLATAEVGDAEISERILAHRARRGSEWQTIEEPIAIHGILSRTTDNQHPATILIDCLTLWLSNLLHYQKNIAQETDSLIASLKNTNAKVIMVSSEVGQGIIPDNALARRFVDEAGILHQKVASIADEVFFVTAGIANKIKG